MSNCNCIRCIQQCMMHPGIFAPGEVEVAAKFMGMGTHEFVRQYVVFDFWSGEDEPVWFPAPRKLIDPRHTHEGKAAFSYAFNPGRCIFLTGHRCQIYKARPAECRGIDACSPEKEPWTTQLIQAWRGRQDRALALMDAHQNARQLDL